MKRNYETPTAEKVEFQYQEQVVASGTEADNGVGPDDILGAVMDYLVENCKNYLPQECSSVFDLFG